MYYTSEGELNVGKIILHLVTVIIGLIIIFGSFVTVDAGYRGIKTRFGSIVGVLDTGLNFKMPFIESVVRMNVQTQKEQTNTEAASSDLQNVSAVIAINYNVQPDKVGELYAKIGEDYKARIIDPAIQESVKAATAKHTAEELVTKRSLVRDEIKQSLSERLIKENLIVTEVSIVNFDFSKSFNQAIEAKVTAEQNALAAKNKLEQVKFEAEQRITQAKGEAEAIRIQAQAITQQGGAEYVRLKSVEKWNGILPVGMYGSAPIPFLDIK